MADGRREPRKGNRERTIRGHEGNHSSFKAVDSRSTKRRLTVASQPRFNKKVIVERPWPLVRLVRLFSVK